MLSSIPSECPTKSGDLIARLVDQSKNISTICWPDTVIILNGYLMWNLRGMSPYLKRFSLSDFHYIAFYSWLFRKNQILILVSFRSLTEQVLEKQNVFISSNLKD